jgi:hypothetical protein
MFDPMNATLIGPRNAFIPVPSIDESSLALTPDNDLGLRRLNLGFGLSPLVVATQALPNLDQHDCLSVPQRGGIADRRR